MHDHTRKNVNSFGCINEDKGWTDRGKGQHNIFRFTINWGSPLPLSKLSKSLQ